MMPSYPVRVLVVDDSAYMRKMIREMLERSPFIEVVGTARDGVEALEMAQELKPDVVTVDLYMPRLDGVGFIRDQMARQPIPIVLCTSASEDVSGAIGAMEAGAVEFVHKPTAQALDSVTAMSKDLIEGVIAAASASFEKLAVEVPNETAQPAAPTRKRRQAAIDAVLIGVSTGGPRALRAILPRFPADFPAPIAIVLHMPSGYTQSLAAKLSELSRIEVVESSDGMLMKPGRAILAQAGIHTRLERQPDGSVVTRLAQNIESEGLYCPSVDELFRSGAEIYGARTLGVILTGMGNDGTGGAAWIKAQGGLVIAEAESTSIIYGMPRSAVEAGLVDQVVPLDRVVETILEMI